MSSSVQTKTVDTVVADALGVGVAGAEVVADGVEEGDGEADFETAAEEDGVGVGVAVILTVWVFPSVTQLLPAATVEVGDGVDDGVALLVAEGVAEATAGSAAALLPHPETARTAAVRPAAARNRTRRRFPGSSGSGTETGADGGQEAARRKNMDPPGNIKVFGKDAYASEITLTEPVRPKFPAFAATDTPRI